MTVAIAVISQLCQWSGRGFRFHTFYLILSFLSTQSYICQCRNTLFVTFCWSLVWFIFQQRIEMSWLWSQVEGSCLKKEREKTGSTGLFHALFLYPPIRFHGLSHFSWYIQYYMNLKGWNVLFQEMKYKNGTWKRLLIQLEDHVHM